MIFSLELLLNLLRVCTIGAHKTQQPLLQIGRGAKTDRENKHLSEESFKSKLVNTVPCSLFCCLYLHVSVFLSYLHKGCKILCYVINYWNIQSPYFQS